MVEIAPPDRTELIAMARNDVRLAEAFERLFQISGQETPEDLDSLRAEIATVTERLTVKEGEPNSASNTFELLRRYTRGLSSEKLVFVADKYDFPPAVSGVITLKPGVTYQVVGDVDLEGDRLVVGGEKVSVIGQTQESSFLRSTGLASGTALLTSEFTLPLKYITLTANTALDFDASANPDQALDWSYVNFVDCPEIGTIKDFNNFIGNVIGILNSEGLTFDGTFGTIAFVNTIMVGRGTGTIIDIPATLTVTRRFRTTYSAIVSFSSSVAFNVDAAATIPVESFIFDTCNFSGGGGYVVGATETDLVALWTNNIGIPNSTSTAWYYMFGNATATTITTVNTPVKVAGVTTAEIEARFDASTTDNRAEYLGAVEGKFKVTGAITFTSLTADQATFYVAKNGVVEAASAITASANVANRAEAIPIFAIVELQNGDFLEVWAENNSAGRNITVSNLNVLVEKSG